MRKRALTVGILSTSAVLGVGWQIGTTLHPMMTTTVAETAQPQTTTTDPTAPAPTTTDPTTPAPTTTAPASTGTDGTYVGTAIRTRYGDVQVQITVAGGTVTDVSPLQLTDADGKSVSISNRAAPVLRQEALDAQSASIQSVSGATYTSEGYISSLQAALDQAGL